MPVSEHDATVRMYRDNLRDTKAAGEQAAERANDFQDRLEKAEAALAKARKEGREEVRERQAVVVDFLDSWRFCPVSEAPAASRSCLEDAAKQLLDSLTKEGS
jgi:hypothetical protein